MKPTAAQIGGGVILGWVCFALGMLILHRSRGAIFLHGPFFLLAVIFSIVAMAHGRRIGGVVLLLCVLIGLSVMWMGLRDTRMDLPAKDAEKAQRAAGEKSRDAGAGDAARPPSPASTRPAVGAVAETLPAAPIPRAAVPDQRTVADAIRRARIAYPALGEGNSPLNREYLARLKRYHIENKEFFSDAEWPMKLAEECQQAIGGK